MHATSRTATALLAAFLFLCSTVSLADVALDSGGLSGEWFDPDRNGEGFFIEIAEVPTGVTFVVAWFTYGVGEDAGGQVWITGATEIPAGATTIEVPVSITSGATFGPAFNPDDVVKTDWGTLTFNFPTCDTGTVDYASTLVGFGSGSLDLERLTSLRGVICTEEGDITPGTWRGPTARTQVVCFNVSLDGTRLERADSNCEDGASLQLKVLGADISGRECFVKVNTEDTIEISESGTFTYLLRIDTLPTQVRGTFTSGSTLSGTADTLGLCGSTFDATPEPAG